MTRYVVVLGSLLSGLGKGVVTASIAKILSFYDYNAIPLKFDGYLNYDCGTMNPFRHGEVFVLDDSSEVDMDFGLYERFLNKDLNGSFSITGGKIFSEVIAKERSGYYLGRDVQIIPHVTDLIIEKIRAVAKENELDILLIEVGGTVGDIENNYFVEAMRQLSFKEKVVFVGLTYVPELDVVGEQKTKPTQIALRVMMQEGIRPNFMICRSARRINESTKSKIGMFANLPSESIIDDSDINNIYVTPVRFMEQGFDKLLLKSLDLDANVNKSKVNEWESRLSSIEQPDSRVNVAIVGKYTNLRDSYASVKEALVHAGAANNVKIDIVWMESEELEHASKDLIGNKLKDMDAIVVPGGFGNRGIEGMISAIEYARENKIPYLGLCLGMQLMAIEFARNACGLKGANSSEFDSDTKYKIIDIMENQKEIKDKGGTMRLGAQTALIKSDTYVYEAYKSSKATERHRHRYELNNEYQELLQRNGLVISATTPDKRLVEMIEWSKSFGIGTQAHPELKSRLESPAPLFVSLIKYAANAKMNDVDGNPER